MGLEPKWGSSDTQNKLFTDHIKESRSRNATAFLHFHLCFYLVWNPRVGTGSPAASNSSSPITYRKPTQ